MTNIQNTNFNVYIVDDDAAVRDSLALLLGVYGYRTLSFDSAENFLKTYQPDWAGCVVSDLKLPGKSGIQLQEELRTLGSKLPFVIITGHGDVPTARSAFLLDAIDFLEKPFNDKDLCAAIEQGFARESQRLNAIQAANTSIEKLADLTPRETEVLSLVGTGLHAKEIASRLDISTRTVEVHKSHLMSKLGARNVAELVRFALAKDGTST
ncbi:hypothetical protein TI04_10575 [Achromatium sp. WMS2]|nr:hypothetical protein TI04_10575 [Achromatium sp. WMS2]